MKTVSVPSAAPALQPPAAALKLMSDERLARWAAKGSQPAFAVIFERHHQALHRYCQSIVGNGHDAADALQNTMVKALGALPGERRTIALKPWLYRIAHNESISLLRARRSDSNLDAAEQIGDRAADTIAESRQRLRDLTSDLAELTEQQRGALLMRELGGLAFDDVSAALQITATAAKQSVYEARCALQALEEGRAMDCDLVRRTLSDGDRRTLRGMRLRGHLRACAGCRDFETALRQRPAHLAALAPPLPLAAAATILSGLLGGGAGHGGGGLLAGIGAGAQTSGAFSLGAAKIATVAVIAGGAAGGAIYVASDGPVQRSDRSPVTRDSAAAGSRPVSPEATARDNEAARARAKKRSADTDATTRKASADNEAVADEAAQRPITNSVPAPATSTRPRQPAAGAAPAPSPQATADAESDDGPPQSVPAAAASAAPPRPAQAPAGAPIPASAPIPDGTPIPTTVPAPATAPAGGSAPAITPPLPPAAGAAPRSR